MKIRRDYSAPVELRDGEGDLPDIVGLAAPFYDARDSGTEFGLWGGAVERIMPTAFDAALESPDRIYASFNHNADNVMGRVGAGTLALETSERGLHYRIKSNDDSQFYREMVSRIRRGDVPGSSIMFSIREDGEDWEREDDVRVRELHSVELYELGPVVNPAYEATQAGLRDVQQLAEARTSYEQWEAVQRPVRHRQPAEWLDKIFRHV